jgi:hypothetical protein
MNEKNPAGDWQGFFIYDRPFYDPSTSLRQSFDKLRTTAQDDGSG